MYYILARFVRDPILLHIRYLWARCVLSVKQHTHTNIYSDGPINVLDIMCALHVLLPNNYITSLGQTIIINFTEFLAPPHERTHTQIGEEGWSE